MLQRFKSLPLEKQLYYCFVSFAAVLLILSIGATLSVDLHRQRSDLDATISSMAAYVASKDSVANMLEIGYPDPAVQNELDELCEQMKGINVLLICDTNGLRFYHTSRRESGDSFVEGDQEAILKGSEPYITKGFGTYGLQRRAFHAVKNENGEILGFVMTSIFQSNILARNRDVILYSVLIFLGALLFATFASHFIVEALKGTLRGHNPSELLALYLQQDDVLNALQDGLIATDGEGRIIFANQMVKELLAAQEPMEGRLLNEFFPETTCIATATTGKSICNRNCVLGGHPALVTEVPFQQENGISNVLSVVHDKSEMVRLSDELSGTRSMLDTLRFFNHEFMNKLHVILGYLQTGETEKAQQFIINSSLLSSQAIRETANCIRVTNICALIIGKMMHAAELGIRLSLAPDSYCMEDDLLLDSQDCLAIVGNLLENAIEELTQGAPEMREIHLALYCRQDCNIILCEDSGRGIAPDLQEHIFEKGVSGKGDNRGLGLHIVKNVVDRYGGTIEIETEQQVGTCFTITFTRKEEV